MPNVTSLSNSSLEQGLILSRQVPVKLTISTAATLGSISITSDNPGVVPYWIGSGTPTDSGTNFSSFTDTSASVIGVLINDGKASVYRHAHFAFTNDLTPSITAISVAKCGASSTGVTASNNVAVSLTLTGITLLATATTQYLGCLFEYTVSP